MTKIFSWLRPICLLLAGVLANPALAQTTYNFTGGFQTYTVPAGVTNLVVFASGASGASSPGYPPAGGAQVAAVVAVTPGEVLDVVVGGQGRSYINYGIGAGGFNGGGTGRYFGGGGATDLRRRLVNGTTYDYLSGRNALLVAGGAGGGDIYRAGSGGQPVGGNGTGNRPGGGAYPNNVGFGYLGGSNSSGGNSSGNGNGGGGGYFGGGASFDGSGGGGGGSSFLGATYPPFGYAQFSTSSQGNGSMFISPQVQTAAPVVNAPANGSSTNSQTPAYSGTAPAFSTVTVIVDGTRYISTTATSGGLWNVTQPTDLSQGSHTVRATAQRSAEAVSASSNTNFTVDTVSPSASITSGTAPNGTTSSSSSFAYTVSFSEAVVNFGSSSVTVGNGTLTNFVAVTGGSTYTFNVTPTANGAVTVDVLANRAQDAASNNNTSANQYTITYAPATATTWTGAVSSDWYTADNWTSGVPTFLLDVVIPAGAPQYPLISAGTAAVRALTVAGGATLTQTAGTLELRGDWTNNGTATLSGLVQLVGSAATQTISGGSSTAFTRLAVNKASGTVQLGQPLTITTALTLTNGTLTTGSYQVSLGSSATLTESNVSYVIGNAVANHSLVPGTAEAFNGLGLTLTPAAGSTAPGPTLVTRSTGTAIAGAGTSQSILRSFNIQPTTNVGLNVMMTFAYFAHELNGIPEANLTLFKSEDGGTPWVPQQGTVASPNVVTATGITDFSVWTLGNSANPLPVVLTAFTAQTAGPAAVRLAWTTASEVNSKRFDVERSSDGHTFATISAAAAAGTSSSARRYELLDTQLPSGKALFYYRLRQVDLDGTSTYSPVRTVALTGAVAIPTLYPNPAQRAVTLTGALPATRVTLFDALGRLVTSVTTDATGTAALTLPAGLAAGVYGVRTGTRIMRLTVE